MLVLVRVYSTVPLGDWGQLRLKACRQCVNHDSAVGDELVRTLYRLFF